MKLNQSILERNFIVMHKGKEYFVNYLNSSSLIPDLSNRYHWEIVDENNEELNIFEFENSTKEERKGIKNNIKLREELIKFCIEHFSDYSPNFKNDF
jgi:hypothetical protein